MTALICVVLFLVIWLWPSKRTRHILWGGPRDYGSVMRRAGLSEADIAEVIRRSKLP